MPRRKEHRSENEWSVYLRVDEIPEKGLKSYKIEASEEARQAVSRRVDVIAISRLEAVFDILPTQGNVFHVIGRFQAEIEQACVVTTEPILTHIEENLEAWFVDESAGVMHFAKKRKEHETQKTKGHVEVEMVDESQDPDQVQNGEIDLGELVVQHLSLAIDPYPHKEGVHYEYTDEGQKTSEPAQSRRNPFEALKDWKENR
jgi:hypothetical protein